MTRRLDRLAVGIDRRRGRDQIAGRGRRQGPHRAQAVVVGHDDERIGARVFDGRLDRLVQLGDLIDGELAEILPGGAGHQSVFHDEEVAVDFIIEAGNGHAGHFRQRRLPPVLGLQGGKIKLAGRKKAEEFTRLPIARWGRC